MELGVHYIDFLPGDPSKLGPTIAATAREAEVVGARMFTLADHFFQMDAVGDFRDPFLEAYTTLGFLAGKTSSITLTALVTGVTYRQPGVLAKIMTTLDVLANGRTMFGIGAGWYEREHQALGIALPPVATRFEMLEETLRIILQIWSDDDGPFNGQHFQLTETLCRPQPVRRPPVLIGGAGEGKMLRLVAKYADVWNTTASIEQLPTKVDVLRRHCDAVGRDFTELQLTASNFADPFADIDAYLRSLSQYAELGFSAVTVGPLPGHPDPVGFVSRLGDEVIPRLPG